MKVRRSLRGGVVRCAKMDATSHRLLGKHLCEYFGYPEEYAEWSVAPDIDLPFLHRFWRHRFSTFESIYNEFAYMHPSVPKGSKIAIGVMLCSHFLLDIYNAPLFCWGVFLPASHIPPELLKEYLEGDYPLSELHKEEVKCFVQHIKPKSASAFMSGVIELLAMHTPFISKRRVRKAKKCVENFCSVSLTETYDLREFDDAFFKTLNEFFAEH